MLWPRIELRLTRVDPGHLSDWCQPAHLNTIMVRFRPPSLAFSQNSREARLRQVCRLLQHSQCRRPSMACQARAGDETSGLCPLMLEAASAEMTAVCLDLRFHDRPFDSEAVSATGFVLPPQYSPGLFGYRSQNRDRDWWVARPCPPGDLGAGS